MNKYLFAACVGLLWVACARADETPAAAATEVTAAVATPAEPKDEIAAIKRELQRVNEKLDSLLNKGDANQQIEQVLRDLTRKIDDMARDIDRMDDKIERIGRN